MYAKVTQSLNLSRWLILPLIAFLGCNSDHLNKQDQSNANKEYIDNLIASDNTNDRVHGIYLIGESKDSSYLKYLLEDLDDIRTSTLSRFKGISIYQAKIIALKKLSNKNPPNSISYKPDSVNINFYINLFKK